MRIINMLAFERLKTRRFQTFGQAWNIKRLASPRLKSSGETRRQTMPDYIRRSNAKSLFLYSLGFAEKGPKPDAFRRSNAKSLKSLSDGKASDCRLVSDV